MLNRSSWPLWALLFFALVLTLQLFAGSDSLHKALHHDVNSHQITGPVLEVNDRYIVVQKGEVKWQIARNKYTKGTFKVGDKVTVQYQMVAVAVEVNGAKAEQAEKPKTAKQQ